MRSKRSPNFPRTELELGAAVGFLSKSFWIKNLAAGGSRARNKRWRSFSTSGLFVPHSKMPDLIVPNRKNKIVKRLGLEVAKSRRSGDEIRSGKYILPALQVVRNDPRVKCWRTKGQRELREAFKNEEPPQLVLTLNNDLNVALETSPWVKPYSFYRKTLRKYRDTKVDRLIFGISHYRVQDIVLYLLEIEHPASKLQASVGFMSLSELCTNVMNAPVYIDDRVESIAEWAAQT
jgi:hypothetical protein